MNRRSFIGLILKACVAPMVLPGASRIWRRERSIIRFVQPSPIVPFWYETWRHSHATTEEYQKAFARMLMFNEKIPEWLEVGKEFEIPLTEHLDIRR